jgi:hypothetical protein
MTTLAMPVPRQTRRKIQISPLWAALRRSTAGQQEGLKRFGSAESNTKGRATLRELQLLDGEICCLRPDGCSDFKSLLFREWSHFDAFDGAVCARSICDSNPACCAWINADNT